MPYCRISTQSRHCHQAVMADKGRGNPQAAIAVSMRAHDLFIHWATDMPFMADLKRLSCLLLS